MTNRSRRWFQLSLKSLFGLTLLVATFFGGYALATKQAEDAVRDARASQGLAEERLKELTDLYVRARLEAIESDRRSQQVAERPF